jgi:hypothetical protein
VERDVIPGPHAVEAERLDTTHEIEFLLRRLERDLDAEAQRRGAHHGNPVLLIVGGLVFTLKCTVLAA